MIEAKGVAKTYGSFVALKNISFQVGRGEIIGLLGPNGAGKTTLIRILTGYHYPSDGHVSIAEMNVLDASRAVKERIGYLPENAPLYQDMHVYEYLRFASLARGVPRSRIEDQITKVVSQCSLKEVLLKPIGDLSRGYCQRVGLAQAMIHDPDILILDEPTSGLDPNQVIEIRNLICQLGKKKTVILSTHVMQEVEAMCNRVLIINQGQLVAQGTTEEIAAQLKGEDRHTLTFSPDNDKTDADTLRKSLQSYPQVHSVVSLQESSDSSADRCIYRAEVLLSKDKATIGGEILFRWAVAQNMTLLSLSSEKFKLEDIFVQLTNT